MYVNVRSFWFPVSLGFLEWWRSLAPNPISEALSFKFATKAQLSKSERTFFNNRNYSKIAFIGCPE